MILLPSPNNQFVNQYKELKNHSGIPPILERRLKPRMKCNYQALVEGSDGSGKKFMEEGRVINLSRSGLFVLMNLAIPDCDEVSARIVLPTGILEFGSTKLTMIGTVVRRESHGDSAFGIAIKFQNFRLH